VSALAADDQGVYVAEGAELLGSSALVRSASSRIVKYDATDRATTLAEDRAADAMAILFDDQWIYWMTSIRPGQGNHPWTVGRQGEIRRARNPL
jgi:hypothetical protein